MACLGSVLNRTGKAKVVLHKTISNLISLMELLRPRVTPVLPQRDLDIVLEAPSKPPYKPLRETSLEHLTLKSVFLLAMASAGRRSELQALRFDQTYMQFKPREAGFTPNSCARTRNRIRFLVPGIFQPPDWQVRVWCS